MKKTICVLLSLAILPLAFLALAACDGDPDEGGVSFTVTFKLKYGTNEGHATITVSSGSSLGAKMPANPTREGAYVFTGWLTEDDTDFTASTKVTADITVLAQWADAYIVTFMKNHSTGDTTVHDTKKVIKNGSIGAANMPSAPTPPSGYVFLYWTTTETGAVRFESTTLVGSNITVYARYADASTNFLVSFELNYDNYPLEDGPFEANPYVDNITVVVGQPVGTQWPLDPERDEYNFLNWRTGSGRTDGTEFTATTPVTGNITLYAQWNPIGGKTVRFLLNYEGAPAEPFHIANIPATVIRVPENVWAPIVPSRKEGATTLLFAGWYENRQGTGERFYWGSTVTESMDVYAQWSPAETEGWKPMYFDMQRLTFTNFINPDPEDNPHQVPESFRMNIDPKPESSSVKIQKMAVNSLPRLDGNETIIFDGLADPPMGTVGDNDPSTDFWWMNGEFKSNFVGGCWDYYYPGDSGNCYGGAFGCKLLKEGRYLIFVLKDVTGDVWFQLGYSSVLRPRDIFSFGSALVDVTD
jgi:uncharacterized repeat protein (TIGR02543 family)